MNRSELIVRVSIEAGLSRRAATSAIDAFLSTIVSTVAAGERVGLPGFGTFEMKERAARVARNPRTSEVVEVAATRVPVFRPSEEFKNQARASSRGRV